MRGLEEQLAAAVTEAGSLNDTVRGFYKTEKARVDAKLGEMDAAIADLPSHMDVQFYVNAASGDDDASGNSANPFLTFEKALSMIPPGGNGSIVLASHVSMTETRATVPGNTFIHVRSSGQNYRLRLPMLEYGGVADNDWEMAGLNCPHGCNIWFTNVTIEFPSTPSTGTVYPFSGLIKAPNTASAAMASASFYQCDFSMPADVYSGAVVMDWHGPAALRVHASTYPYDMAGKWIDGISAGTLTANTSRVLSNMGSL